METDSEIWQKFIALPGSIAGEYVGIASQYAISGLLEILYKRSPRRILEIGAGIGTLTYTILSWARSVNMDQKMDYTFITIENNAFCQKQLTNNLISFRDKYCLVSSMDEVRQICTQFDLIVVDGGDDLPSDMGFMAFNNLLQLKGAIFVEGERIIQRQKIREWYGNRLHIYVKMEAAQPHLQSLSGNISATNLPYHLFIFEPNFIEAISYKVGGLLNYTDTRLARNVMRAK